jgi:hypothetical protein
MYTVGHSRFGRKGLKETTELTEQVIKVCIYIAVVTASTQH